MRGGRGGCVGIPLDNFEVCIWQLSLTLAKFFPSTVQNGAVFVFLNFMFAECLDIFSLCMRSSALELSLVVVNPKSEIENNV